MLLEGILFGCFAILYPISLWILLYKHGCRGYSRLGMLLFAIVTIMFVLALTVCHCYARAPGPIH